MKYLLFILLLFPAMTFGIFSNISTMPYGFLLLLFYPNKVLPFFIKAISILSIFIFISFIFNKFDSKNTIESIIALINATIVIPFILKLNQTDLFRLIKCVKFTIISILIVGVLQFLLKHPAGFETFLFGRSSGLNDIKGVPSLSSEPARSALDLFLFTLLLIFSNRNKNLILNYVLYVFIFIYILLINKSITGYMYLFIYFFFIFLKQSNLKIIIFSFIFVTLILILFLFSIKYTGENRVINTLTSLYNSSNKSEIVYVVSGHRFVGLLASINEISLFGNGVGNWNQPVLKYMDEHYEVIQKISFYRVKGYEAIKPMSFFGRYFLEIGVIGFVSYFLLVLRNTLHLSLFLKFLKEPEPLTVFISLFLLSYGGSPTPFIALFIMYRLWLIRDYSVFKRDSNNNILD